MKSYSITLSTPEKMCSGMIHAAFQRTEKIEWNLELGFWSMKWTVRSSGGVNAFDLGRELPTPGHCRIRHLSFDGADDVVASNFSPSLQ